MTAHMYAFCSSGSAAVRARMYACIYAGDRIRTSADVYVHVYAGHYLEDQHAFADLTSLNSCLLQDVVEQSERSHAQGKCVAPPGHADSQAGTLARMSEVSQQSAQLGAFAEHDYYHDAL
eukprot:6180974-Pleurochrysis_carterae.AAC.1